jgi:biotin carboxyl carrier protein
MRRYAVAVLPGQDPLEVEVHEESSPEGAARRIRVIVGGQERVVEVRAAGPGRYTWLDGLRVVTAEVEPVAAKAGAEVVDARKLAVAVRGETFAATVRDARALEVPALAGKALAAGPATLRAPMPGRVVKLLVRVGDEVKAGAGVIVVEAMKMENELRAPRDGKLREFRVKEGEAVEAGQELCVVE